MNLMLKMYLPQFIHLARAGADEETYANMILDHVPDAAVMQFVNRPDYMDYLASFDPAVREPVIAAWFEKLRVKLMEFLTEPEIPGLNDVNADISTDTL